MPGSTAGDPPTSIDALIARGRAAGRQQRYDEALRLFAEVRERAPERVDGHLGVAQASAYLQDFEAALRAVAAAIEADPTSLSAYGLLTQLGLRLGHPEVAQPALERAGLRLTTTPAIFQWLAQVYATTGDSAGLRGAVDHLASLAGADAGEITAALATSPDLGPEAKRRLEALAG